MPVRSTMASLIARVRILINDPAGGSPQFADQTIQDVLDESRQDVFNQPLRPEPTYSGGTITFLDYLSDLGGWEDGMTLKQFLTVDVTSNASLIEPITGHFQFSATTLPPVMITGRIYDVYRASADLLERLIAQWTLRYDITVDGQSLRRSQAALALHNLVENYRRKQRPRVSTLVRSDLRPTTSSDSAIPGRPGPSGFGVRGASLQATELDYMASGNPGG